MSADTFTTDPFMASTGGRPPAIKFDAIGDTITGIVEDISEQNDTDIHGTPKTWPSGEPMKMWIFTLDVDGEKRSLFVRGNMVKAIKTAAIEAGAPTMVGRELTVQHHALGDKKPGMAQAKLFRAKVEVAPARQPAASSTPW